jgi:hypothetical protein
MDRKDKRMTCADVQDAVYGYVACSLAPDEITAFYEHLVTCEDCRLHVTCYRTVVSLLREEKGSPQKTELIVLYRPATPE